MKKYLITYTAFLFLIIGISTAVSIQGQTPSMRISNRQVNNLLTSIEAKTNAYKSIAVRGNNRGVSNQNGDLASYVQDFQAATAQLRQRLNERQAAAADVENVLNKAGFIDSFMRNNRSSSSSQSQWDSIKTDLNSLAGYYNVSWNWNNNDYPNSNSNYPNSNNNYPNQNYPANRGDNRGDMRLTGTYKLNVSQSDDVKTAVDRAINTNNYENNQRDRSSQNLERRLTPPDTIVIDRGSNRQFTIGSSKSPQVTLTADGIAHTEQTPNGKTVSVKTESSGNNLNISYEGDRTNDFYVTFMPMYNGQLKVTRRIYLENRNQTITVSSVYDKTSQTADWSSVNNGNYNGGYNQNNGNYNGGNNQNSGYNDDFVIPNGTKIIAVLATPLSTKTSVDGDRFTMNVNSPSQYSGATIEGHVSNSAQSGRISGRAQIALIFDRINLSNGRSYRFSGLIDSIRSLNGDNININNEGVVRDSNQTTKTVTRTGIGAGIGAIIGAIAGGGQGAAIGAAVGAGAGAGSVVIQGKDNLELQSGTEFNLTSSAPSNVRASY